MEEASKSGDAIQQQLHKLDGIVRYKFVKDTNGNAKLDAKWISTRTVDGGKPCPGHAYRRPSPNGSDQLAGDGGDDNVFEGAWTVEYYGLNGKLQVTPFLLDLERKGDIYHGKWADPEGKPLLTGFGFIDDGSLYMRYGM